MSISRENYELAIIDFLDGKLDAAAHRELMRFLERNPDLKAEFDLLEKGMTLEPAMPELPDFSNLKKQEALSDIPAQDVLLIDLLEKNLDYEQEQVLRSRMEQEPALASAFATYEKTVLKPDNSLRYPNPQLLKKQARVIELFSLRTVSRIAAVLTLGTLVWLGVNRLGSSEQLAMQKTQLPVQTAPLAIASKEVKTPESQNSSVAVKSDKTAVKPGKVENSKPIIPLSEEPVAEELPVTKVQLAVNELQGKTASLSVGAKLVTPEVQALSRLEASQPSAEPLMAAEFKTPAQWLKDQAKNRLPMARIAQADSLIKTGDAGMMALNIINQAPGVLASAKTEASGQTRGFSIVSRYFSIERSY